MHRSLIPNSVMKAMSTIGTTIIIPKKNGLVPYYKCKHFGSSYKCKSKLSIVDGCVKTSKINHSCKQEMKPSETIIEDATDRMTDMVSTIALGSPERSPADISRKRNLLVILNLWNSKNNLNQCYGGYSTNPLLTNWPFYVCMQDVHTNFYRSS